MESKLSILKGLFLKHTSLDVKNEDEILNYIDQILYDIITSNVEELRYRSFLLSEMLHQIGTNAVPYLLLLVFRKNEPLHYKKTLQSKIFCHESNNEIFEDIFRSCLNKYNEKGIRLLTFELPEHNESHDKFIYASTRNILDSLIHEPIDKKDTNSDMMTRIVCLGLSRKLSHVFDCQYEFYIQIKSMLSRMNRDGYFQDARDYAEEILYCAHIDNELFYGFYTKFSLYTEQTNVIDSLLNGCLLLTAINNVSEIPQVIFDDIQVNIFTALRAFGFFDLATTFYKEKILKLSLDEYDKQKCRLSYFYLLLMGNRREVVDQANSYIKTNSNNIKKYSNASLIPWFAFICNVKIAFNKEYNSASSLIELEEYINKNEISPELESIKNKILHNIPNTKKEVQQGLINLSKTRNKTDFIYEVNQLVATANRLIESSINNGDIEAILLSHELKSDGSVYFSQHPIKSVNGIIQKTFEESTEELSRFNNYLQHITKALPSQGEKQYLWIGLNGDKIYCVIYENGKFNFCNYITSTDAEQIKEWCKNKLPNLGFQDTPNTGSPFITREDIWKQEYLSIIDDLPDFDIPISSREIILFCDVEFSSFPHNMIKRNGELISLTNSISSPLSFANYLRYTDIKIDTNKIYAWAPTNEGDMAISIAFSKLRDELKCHNVTYDETTTPNPNGDINIFISHGGKNAHTGFRGLYPCDDKAYNVDVLFGKGKIAILFICHSGSIVENIYSHSSHTLVKTLLDAGYESVICPSWSLNVSIPGIWTKQFVECLRSGIEISKAVFEANSHVHDKFISPSASVAMHLFGNSEIQCNISDSKTQPNK